MNIRVKRQLAIARKRDKNSGLLLWTAPLFLMVFLILFAVPADAADEGVQEISVTAVDPIHDVIRRQLDAINDRDADAAFALTTEQLHQKHEDARNFLYSVRTEYRPLYNHVHYEFLERNDIGNARLQKVEIEDRYAEEPVIAIFRMEQQDDGNWLVDSVMVLYTDDADPI